MDDPIAIVDTLSQGGLLAGLVIVIVGGLKGWWIFGWIHRYIVQDLTERLAASESREAVYREQAWEAANRLLRKRRTTS